MRFLWFNLLSIWAAIAFTQSFDYNENFDYPTELEVSPNGTYTPLERYLQEEMIKSATIIVERTDLSNSRIASRSGKLFSLMSCVACRTFFTSFLLAIRIGTSRGILNRMAKKICSVVAILMSISENVCKGLIDMNMDIILYVVNQKRTLDATKICSVLLQQLSCMDFEEDWEIKIPNRMTNFDYRNVVSKNLWRPIKILQLTDLHYDPRYLAGSNAVCNEPLCCQAQSIPRSPRDAAGFWGDYRKCDTPWNLFENAIDHILAQHKDIDLVYFTGDVIDHCIWATTQASNIETITQIYGYLNHKFKNIPVYYVLGNHEANPVNQYAPVEITQPRLSSNWLFKLAVDQWNLPEDTYKTILRGGYYTTLVKPGFRIVALNSNVCYILNWWLLYSDVDPYGQLEWLVDVLSQAENNKEMVHIISHVPSNDGSCLHNWAKEYVRIIQRFSNIITAQFNGHTHLDDFIVYFNDMAPFHPSLTAFNGGSLTTYDNLNPNYKIYFANPSNLQIEEAESWTYNITSANLTPYFRPNWYKLYSFNEEFGQTPSSVGANIIYQLTGNATTFRKFYKFKHRGSDPTVLKGCDKKCRIKSLCDLVTPYSGSKKQCKYINSVFAKLG